MRMRRSCRSSLAYSHALHRRPQRRRVSFSKTTPFERALRIGARATTQDRLNFEPVEHHAPP